MLNTVHVSIRNEDTNERYESFILPIYPSYSAGQLIHASDKGTGDNQKFYLIKSVEHAVLRSKTEGDFAFMHIALKVEKVDDI